MNSVHDLGGMMGFGPVESIDDESNFHGRWEERIFALTLAMGATGSWNIDQSRHARESLPPAQYLSSTYYQIWLAGLEKLLIGANLVSQAELDQGKSLSPPKPVKNVLKSDNVMAAMMAGSPYDRPAGSAAKFAIGDEIRPKNLHPQHHTRLPQFARDKPGIISQVHGCHVFPDSNARSLGEDPHWLYKVQFSARDIWGDSSPENDRIFIDLWEPYLEQR